MPAFSIIIPNYNHSAFLKQRIDSVLAQTYPDFEVIILDDKSIDDSKNIIESYRHHSKISHIIYNDVNSRSPFLQWEKGIKLAKADWIWVAESDDIADPSFLQEAASVLQNNPSVGCYYSDSYIIDKDGTITGKVSSIKNNFFETQKWSASYLANGIDELNEYLKYLSQ